MIKHFGLRLALAVGAFALTTPQAFAGNGTRLIPSNFIAIRPAGMGQAFTAVADDQNAMYYNPAGLAKLDGWSLEIVAPFGGVNSNLYNNVTPVSDFAEALGQGSGSTDQMLDNVSELLDQVSGKNNYVRVGLAPYFVMPRFGIATNIDNQIELTPHGQIVPNLMSFAAVLDQDVRVGYAHPFFGKKLSVGVSAHFHSRGVIATNVEIFKILDATKNKKMDELYKDILRAGYGVGADAGLLFTPIEYWSPTIGLSVLNIADTRFTAYEFTKKDFSGKAPDPMLQSVNMGVSVTPSFKQWFVRGAMDFRDINIPTTAAHKPVLGFEAGFKGKYISAMAQTGMSEGYLTAGFEARLIVLTLRYATYATDRGYYTTQKQERRHLVGLKILL